VSARFLSADHPDWEDLNGDNAAALAPFLSQLLTSRNLALLAGLGTSLHLEGRDGRGGPTMKGLWDAVKGANQERFDAVLKAVSWEQEGEDVELLLSRCQMRHEIEPDDELKDFIEAGEEAIARACDFIEPDTDLGTHEAFLRRIARRSTKLPRTQLYTTNYDLAYESAAARIGFAVIDGFSASAPARFDPAAFDRDHARRSADDPNAPIDWLPNVVQLHKLHGSIDWSAAGEEIHRAGVSDRPVIIYPRSTKFEVSYRQPFLELMSRFQSALRRPDTGLIIAGSGLSDPHISQPLMAAVRGNVGLNLLVTSSALEQKTEGPVSDLVKLIKQGDRRIALLATTFEEAVPILPDLVAEMEEEKHAERVSKLDHD
jgi:hypothetical protein